jgi:hypothetical protein
MLENSLGSSTLGPLRYLVRWAGVQTRIDGDGCCGEKWVVPEALQDVPKRRIGETQHSMRRVEDRAIFEDRAYLWSRDWHRYQDC